MFQRSVACNKASGWIGAGHAIEKSKLARLQNEIKTLLFFSLQQTVVSGLVGFTFGNAKYGLNCINSSMHASIDGCKTPADDVFHLALGVGCKR